MIQNPQKQLNVAFNLDEVKTALLKIPNFLLNS